MIIITILCLIIWSDVFQKYLLMCSFKFKHMNEMNFAWFIQ